MLVDKMSKEQAQNRVNAFFSSVNAFDYEGFTSEKQPESVSYSDRDLKLMSGATVNDVNYSCLLYTSPSPRDTERSRMPSSA